MGISTSYSYDLICSKIINAALRKLGVLAQGQTATGNMVVEALEALNLIVKELQNEEVFLWTREWKEKTFSASSEVTGTDGLIYTCISSHTSSSDDKPITGANYHSKWVERGSTGGVWATSTAYTSNGEFTCDADTVGIEKVVIRDGVNDYPVEIISWEKYADILDKTSTGRPFCMVFDQQLTPRCYLYYLPDVTTYILRYLRVRLLKDFSGVSNNPDSPSSMLSVLVWKLAAELCAEYAIPLERTKYIEAKAIEKWMKFRGSNSETAEDCFLRGAF